MAVSDRFNTAKATEHYEKFLTLWKDADPGIAEVANARERVECKLPLNCWIGMRGAG